MEEKNSSKGLLVGIVIAVLAIAGLVIFVLSSRTTETPQSTNNQTETTTKPTESDAVETPQSSEGMNITYTDAGFEPGELTVKTGTVITIKNESSRDVQFSSDDHPAHRNNTQMNLRTLSPGESATYTATVAGEWGFHDHIDESKTGTITVTE